MDDIRAAYRARPVVTLDDGNRVLDKHSLGSALSVEALGPYVINFVYKVVRPNAPPLVLKGQYLATMAWDVDQETEAIRLLQAGTDLPVPGWAVYDGDCDALGHPFVLIDWLDGRSSLDIYEEADPSRRVELAEQHGAIHRAIHDCPVPSESHLPVVDLRGWRHVVQDLLFAGDEFHDALRRLCPAYEDALRLKLDHARELSLTTPPVLTWRDGSLGNTMSRLEEDDSPCICGVFDFQSAILMQPHWDLIKAFNSFVPGTDPDRAPTPEWHAFCRGFGRDVPLEGAEKQAFAVVFPAMHTRHWWEPMGFFHPQTPNWLDGLLAELDRLGE